MLFQKNNQILNKIFEDIEKNRLDLIGIRGLFIPGKSYIDLIKKDSKEMKFLEKIYEVDKKFEKFYTSNWPKGFRYESMNFYWNYNFEYNLGRNKKISSYRIKIEEDYLTHNCHMVSFLFSMSNETKEIRLRELIEINYVDINSEINALLMLDNEKMIDIGQKNMEMPKNNVTKYGNSLIVEEEGKITNRAFLSLLKLKFEIIIFEEISDGKNSYIRVGITYRENDNREISRRSELTRRRLITIVEENNFDNIKIRYNGKIYGLKEVFNYIGYEYKDREDWEILLMLSERDLLVLAKVIEDMDKNTSK